MRISFSVAGLARPADSFMTCLPQHRVSCSVHALPAIIDQSQNIFNTYALVLQAVHFKHIVGGLYARENITKLQ